MDDPTVIVVLGVLGGIALWALVLAFEPRFVRREQRKREGRDNG